MDTNCVHHGFGIFRSFLYEALAMRPGQPSRSWNVSFAACAMRRVDVGVAEISMEKSSKFCFWKEQDCGLSVRIWYNARIFTFDELRYPQPHLMGVVLSSANRMLGALHYGVSPWDSVSVNVWCNEQTYIWMSPLNSDNQIRPWSLIAQSYPCHMQCG